MAAKTSVLRGPKSIKCKTRSVARTMTTGTALCTLPRGSRLLGITISGVASNAGTTATIQFGTTTAATQLTAAENVLAAGKGAGGFIGIKTVQRAAADDYKIYAIYAESGTASDTGAWMASIMYTEGNDIADDDE
jgi:hypothetical protein